MTATFEVEPTAGLIDEPIGVRLRGLQPDIRVVVEAEAQAGVGRKWRSRAEFTCGPAGMIDLARDPAIAGSYEGTDPMGLFWSMAAPRNVRQRDFLSRTLNPVEVNLSAEVAGEIVASVSLRRMVVGPEIRRIPVLDQGLVGSLFHPQRGDQHPGVILLGGSEGGLVESFAAALANRGYAALALAYFAADRLPKNLCLIPLEYFGRAIAWMASHPAVAGNKLTVIGASKGGELALLLAATYSEIGAAVALVPSGVAFYGLGRNPLSVFKSSWSFRGKPVSYVPMRFTPNVLRAVLSRRPLEIRAFYDPALENTKAVRKAEIAVERIRGPVLLVSAEDDRMWPSPRLAQIAADRLDAHHYPYPYSHIRYSDCGHAIGLPNLPSVNSVEKAFMGRDVLLGGTPRGNAQASVNGWARILEFLAEHCSSYVRR
ncbi:MAG: hypothetical protein E6I38_06420 [Chloroflexi bacterium]|nr:MAG: hypothetical protein E6I38_06420 [Chloroflexota bacterium]